MNMIQRMSRMASALLAITLVSITLPGRAAAAGTPSTSDLWDTSQGTQITAMSGMQSGFSSGDMFGGAASTVEPGNTIFADGKPAGFTHYIEWRTVAPVIVTSFALFATGDGPTFRNQREFDRFVLKARSPGSPTFDLVLYDYTPTHPYTFLDAPSLLLLSTEITAVTAQEFRAEFVQSTALSPYNGPRIVELDAFGSVVSPPPAAPKDFLAVDGLLATPRISHSSTLLADGRVLLSGGFTPVFPVAALVDIFDPAANALSAGGSMLLPRVNHTANLLPDGKVLIAGGTITNNVITTLCEVFDPATGQSTFTGSMVLPRRGHLSVSLPDGRVVLLGGGAPAAAREVQMYDPATGTFTLTGTMNALRSLFSATLLKDGRILIAGGFVSNVAQATAEIYDPATRVSTYVGNMSVPRAGHGDALLADGRVLLTGGRSTSSVDAVASAEIFDPATGTFTMAGSMTTPRTEHTTTALFDGKVLVSGGISNLSTRVTFKTAEVYDPVSNQFSPVGEMSSPRTSHRATLLPSGQVLVSGGRNNNVFPAPDMFVRTAELYDAILTFRASEISAVNNAIRSLTNQVNQLQAQNAALNTQLTDANATIGSLQGQVSLLAASNVALTTTLTQAQTDLANANLNIAMLTASNTMLQAELATANSLIDSQQVQISALTSNVTALTSQLQQCQADLAAALATNQALTNQVAVLTATNQQLRAQLDASSQQVTRLTQIFRNEFGDPNFTLPGDTLEAQLSYLVQAVSESNHGQKQVIYLILK